MQDDNLTNALDRLHSWMTESGERFCPQEETLQSWLGLALVSGGFCKPQHLLSEVTFGEDSEDEGDPWAGPLLPLTKQLGVGGPGKYLRYDLTVVSTSPSSDGRSFGTCDPPRCLMEVKALNSYGSLKRHMLFKDMAKLVLGREWWKIHHNHHTDTLMVVLATDMKPVSNQTTPENVASWVKSLSQEPLLADVSIALVLEEGVRRFPS